MIEFLRARLDEDEAAPLRWPAEQHSWTFVGERRLSYDNRCGEDVAAIDVSGHALWWERIYVKRDINGLSDHIARHDPVRALREVAAKRAVLTLHDHGGVRWTGFPRADQQEQYCLHDQHSAPCPTLRLAAVVYADHPDYQRKWTP